MDTDKHRYEKEKNTNLNELTFCINGCAMSVLNKLGHGFHEKIYENALALEFAHNGLDFSQQQTFDVVYRNEKIGTFIPDFVIESRVIVELKTLEKIGSNEKGQVINYLRACNLPLGLILNFKHPKLEWQRVVL